MNPSARFLGPGIGVLCMAVAAAPVGRVGPLVAQETPGSGTLRAAVRSSADTVAVGEPFTIGVVATARESVRFPPLLGVDEAWEQLQVARVEREAEGSVRAYYRLVAWEAGRHGLPDLVVSTGERPGREFRIEMPAPFVRSVLPAETEDVRLRGPWPPLGPGFPWLLALALLLLGAIAFWWWRRRRVAAAPKEIRVTDEPDAAGRARAALLDLRDRATSGELDAAAFYDRLEEILREYLAGTRDWPSTRPVRASLWASRGAMRELNRRAVKSRFAAIEAPGARRVTDVDVSLEWLEGDAA